MFDRPQARVHVFRLEGATKYTRVVPREGRDASRVLGLGLLVEGEALQLMQGAARLEDPDERIGRLGVTLDEVLSRAEQEAARAEQEAARASALAAELAEARAEIERRKGR